MKNVTQLVPGVALAALGVALALLINSRIPTVSALLVAIVLGILVRNLLRLPEAVEPGLAFSAKRLLRTGVVLLGLQLVVADILALGAGMIVTVMAVVLIGIASTILLGRWLGMTPTQTLLVACGFSICGAAAVAAVDGVIETEDEEDVVTAIALVVLFGTLMIPLLPAVAGLLGMGQLATGLWAGASVHEVAQVVAIGGSISAAALSGAVVVKLARVLMLAPVMAVISLVRRNALRATGKSTEGGKLPPIMPLFVFGFILMVAVRATGVIPADVLAVVKVIQTGLLAAAMFALGTGVKIRSFAKIGAKPFVLAACSTLIVGLVGYAGVMLAL